MYVGYAEKYGPFGRLFLEFFFLNYYSSLFGNSVCDIQMWLENVFGVSLKHVIEKNIEPNRGYISDCLIFYASTINLVIEAQYCITL